MTTKPIILDTDIGTDVDDCLALALILASPELELVGITATGDVALRGRMIARLLQRRGVTGIPVAVGGPSRLLGKRRIYWAGHEGQGGPLTPEVETLPLSTEHAADLIVRMVMARPGEITVAAIGPFTNLAVAFLKEPRLARTSRG